ncbi:MAG: aromatic hydrocarbon degradation protein [Bacteroidota bacterium]|nr:aromatic hydrocarbon degradation protein [Bacteroidota bacterium]
MKRIIFITLCIASSQYIMAQEPPDALRYSWYTSNGTARQLAIGGAGGSLGGDISATFVNPAGLGFYKTGDFVLTPGFNSLKNKATYFGRTEKDNKTAFSFGTSGLVMGGPNNFHSNKSSAFALAVNRVADFNSNILYRGTNTQSSYSQKFLEEISNNNDHDGNSVAQNYPFGTSLAFNTYWIDTANGWSSGNKQFVSMSTPLLAGAGLLQEQRVTNKGGITELALAGAWNNNDKFYVGGTLGIPFLHYSRESVFTEADATSNPNNNFDFASITENLTTSGVGINLKLGMIYKPAEYVRLGLAFHSPTYFTLTDKYNASVTTNTEGYQGQWTQSSDLFTSGKDAQFKYTLFTPYRVIASGSYVFREIEDVRKQKGFLTADIEYINYKASSYKTDPNGDNSQTTKDYLKSLNKAIDNAYKGALNFRVGGELKFTTIMVRLGGAYYGNPYKNIAGENGHRFQLTGGLGYRDKGFFIDLAYGYTMGKDIHFPYRLQSAAFTGAVIKNTGGTALLTFGFKI